MRNDFLFSYMIDCAKVDVYHLVCSDKTSFENNDFYNGLVAAVAEYLCYPYGIIAPRAQSFSVKFDYDCKELKNSENILECTKKAVLNYMEESEEHANIFIPEYATTPNLKRENIDDWCKTLREMSNIGDVRVQELHTGEDSLKWLEFCYGEEKFYGRYRDKDSKYLMVSLPGYNSDWNDLSKYMSGDYDILQLSPLGYNTPSGFNLQKRIRGAWPVLYETVSAIDKNVGYNKWFYEVCLAIKAVRKENQKLIFLGTSQGGGASLLMSSVFNDCTVACSAEMPFLIGFSDKNYKRVRDFVGSQIGYTGQMIYDFWAKERLYVLDPINHIQRISCKTFLLAGGLDEQCPKEDIEFLYDKLQCPKKYVLLEESDHGYTEAFKKNAVSWIEEAIKAD